MYLGTATDQMTPRSVMSLPETDQKFDLQLESMCRMLILPNDVWDHK